MKIFRQISEFTTPCHPVVTVGVFDGVHKGHLEIIDKLSAVAKAKKCESVVITFEPHPRLVLPHHAELRLLQTLDEKLERFEIAGVDSVLVIPFDREFAKISPSVKPLKELVTVSYPGTATVSEYIFVPTG